MSSEGSVTTNASSRIRQFGLYRSIDAKTEEFLRLSRRRQIKQGCACAVISTAVTVTVVIAIFLVYFQHGIRRDKNKQPLTKTNWISFINGSIDSTFEGKFDKTKFNFDRNTIKLLPLLIKILKQNRHLEKIIEEYSSPSPTYEGKYTTEFSFKRGIFMKTKDWLKKPITKLYSVEYKTSPLFYFKNPLANLAYFTKTRKIRDYKRVKEYVDKMINDKIVDHTLPSNNYKSRTKTLPNKISKIKTLRTKTLTRPHITKHEINKENDKVRCKCPKNFGYLLNKIFSNIQLLLSENKTTPCPLVNNSLTNTSLIPTTNQPVTTNTKVMTTTTTHSILSSSIQKKNDYPLLFSEFNNIFKEDKNNASVKINKMIRKENTTLTSSKTFQVMEKQMQVDLDKYGKQYLSTAITQYIEPTEDIITVSSSLPMSYLKNVARKDDFTTGITTKKYISQNIYKTKHEKTTNWHSNDSVEKPIIIKTDNNMLHSFYSLDNLDKITPSITNKADMLTIPNINYNNEQFLSTTEYTVTSTTNIPSKLDFEPSTSTTDIFNLINDSSIEIHASERTSFLHQPSITIRSNNSEEQTKTTDTFNILPNRNSTLKLTVTNIVSPKNTNLNHVNPNNNSKQHIARVLQQDDPYKILVDEDYDQDYTFNTTESTIFFPSLFLNNSLLYQEANKIETEIMKESEDHKGITSMIPEDRPTYLQIYRDGWKQEENDEFDLNIHYNVFDV